MIEISREKPPEAPVSRPASANKAAGSASDVTRLEKGSTIEGTVVERRGGFDIIDVAGQALKARSANPLPQGAEVRLEVLKPGSPVQVRLLSVLTPAQGGEARQAEALTREMLNVRAELAGMHSVFSRSTGAGVSSSANIHDFAQAESPEKTLGFLLRGLEQGADADPGRSRAMAAMFQKQGDSGSSLLKQIMVIFRQMGNNASSATPQKVSGGAAQGGGKTGQAAVSQEGGSQAAEAGTQAGNIARSSMSPAKAAGNHVSQGGKTGSVVMASQSEAASPSNPSTGKDFTPLFANRSSAGSGNGAGGNPVPGRSGSAVSAAPGGISAGKPENTPDIAEQPAGKQSMQQMPTGLYKGQSAAGGTESRPFMADPSASQHNQQQAPVKGEYAPGGSMVSTPPGSRGTVLPGSAAAGGRGGAPLQSGSSGKGSGLEQGTAPLENMPSGTDGGTGAGTVTPGSSSGSPSAGRAAVAQGSVREAAEQAMPEARNDTAIRDQAGQAAGTVRNSQKADGGRPDSASPVHADAGPETARRSTAASRMETAPGADSRPVQTSASAGHQLASGDSGTFRFFSALASHGESVQQYQQQMQDFLNTPFFMVPLWFENGHGHGHWSWWSESEDEEVQAGTEIQHLAFDLELTNLGRINIHILRDGQGISLHAAASREILPLLRAGMQELKGNLEALGFSFSVADIFPIEETDAAEFLNPAAPSRKGASSLNIMA